MYQAELVDRRQIVYAHSDRIVPSPSGGYRKYRSVWVFCCTGAERYQFAFIHVHLRFLLLMKIPGFRLQFPQPIAAVFETSGDQMQYSVLLLHETADDQQM